MSKGQTLIVQFIIFFLVGLSLFTIIGSFFKFQTDIFREDVANDFRKLSNSYISAIAITLFDTCKMCDNVNISVKIPTMAADYFHDFEVVNNTLKVTSRPGENAITTSLHNLNWTINLSGGAPSAKIIVLTIENKNKLLNISWLEPKK